MRIVEKLLYGMVGLLGLILLFIVLCHFNPSIAENIGNTIQANAQENHGLVSEDALIAEKNALEVVKFPSVTSTGLVPEIQQKYEKPDEDRLEIPSRVAEKNGYEPVIESGKQISKERAEEILSTLGMGNLGEDYAYSQEYYPYYYMLDEDTQKIYRQIHGNTDSLNKSFAPVTEDVTPAELKNAFMAVCNDHPELFWLNMGISYKYAPSGKIVQIDLSFNYTANSIDQAKQSFEQNAKDIIYGTRGIQTDYEKEVFVHDSLVEKLNYDLNAPINQSAYSALVQNRTVCAGYARAFQYIMQQLSIPTYYCTGYAGQNHAWNIIKLDGEYYNVDVTWDDTKPSTYDYFNCSDLDYATDHARRDLSVYLPPCNGSVYSDLEESEEEKAKREQEELNKLKEQLEAEEQEESRKEDEKEEENESDVLENNTEQIKIEFVRKTADGDIIILSSLQEYYTDCAQAMMDDNDNSISFYNVIANEKLWNEIKKAYEKGEYNGAYMNRVLADKHKTSCSATVTGQKLDDGTYLVRHVMILK